MSESKVRTYIMYGILGKIEALVPKDIREMVLRDGPERPRWLAGRRKLKPFYISEKGEINRVPSNIVHWNTIVQARFIDQIMKAFNK